MSTRNGRFWEQFPDLFGVVEQDHLSSGAMGSGHEFLHAFMVAQYAGMIVEDERNASIAWVAGLLHNTDRILSEVEVPAKIKFYLENYTGFSEEEKKLIIEAVQDHSKLNDPNDNPITIALKDADRLANIGPQFFIRVAQDHRGLSAVDPKHTISNPDSTANYRNSKTVATHVGYSLEWQEMLRLPRAKELGKRRFELTRICLEDIESQLEEIGLYPYPFEKYLD